LIYKARECNEGIARFDRVSSSPKTNSPGGLLVSA